MKTLKAAPLLWVLAFAFTARCADTPAGNKAEAPEDLALFDNGDTLSGSMAGCDKAGLHWEPAYESRPVVVTTSHLREIRFRPRKIPSSATQPANNVLLANGDALPGIIVSLNDKSLVLETWYAGRLVIPREMTRGIIPAGVLFKGPGGLDGWEIKSQAGKTGWSYKDGVLYSDDSCATIGRDLKPLSQARIEFDLSSSGAYQFFVCSSQPETPGASYVFQVDARTQLVDAARYSPDSANVRIGLPAPLSGVPPAQPARMQVEQHAPQAPIGGMLRLSGPGSGVDASPDKNHFDIRISRPAKTIWLFVNGRMVEEYSHLDDLPKLGGSLIFRPDSPLQIRKIKIGIWDGDLGGARSDAAAKPGEESIKAVNRESITGKLKSIANGKVMFASAQGDLEIPVAEAELIRMAAAPAGEAKTGANDVRALLLVQGRVTMSIESWSGKGVTVTSPDFGRAEFKPEAFRLLRFNLKSQPAPEGNTIDTDDADDDD